MIKKHFRGSPPAEVLAPAVENAAVPEQPVPEPALTDAEAVMLEHDGADGALCYPRRGGGA